MTLSKPSIEMLIDMLENRLSDMVVTDREDAKEHLMLKRALQELAAVSLSEQRSSRRRVAAVADRPVERALPVSAAARPVRRPMLRNNPMMPIERSSESGNLIGHRITEMA